MLPDKTGGAEMLKVYIADWCFVCGRVIDWLKENSIPFTSVDIE